MNQFAERLSLLRISMKERRVDFYIIPSSDPHLGEYIPQYWRIVEWLTGFTGSFAVIIVTDSFAGLWTDSRYIVQAEKQLEGTGFCLVKPGSQYSGDYIEWLSAETGEDVNVGFDGRIFSITELRKIRKGLDKKIVLLDTECDLITPLWTDRPTIPASAGFDHPLMFCGKDRSEKITEVRNLMKKLGVGYHLLTSPDDIMWLLNIRGNDLKYSPLLLSYTIIGEEQVLLFIEESSIPLKLAREFDQLGVVMLPYEEAAPMISTLEPDMRILISPATTSVAMFNSLPSGMEVIEDISIPSRIKAIKNITEIENIRKVMIKDGVALTKFFFWFEQMQGKSIVTEISLSEKLALELRREQENYLGPSFAAIVAFNDHGALPHYTATLETDYKGIGNLLEFFCWIQVPVSTSMAQPILQGQ